MEKQEKIKAVAIIVKAWGDLYRLNANLKDSAKVNSQFNRLENAIADYKNAIEEL